MGKIKFNCCMLLGILRFMGFIGFFHFEDCIGYIWFMFFSFFSFFTWGILYKQKQDERFCINRMRAQKVSLVLAFIVLIFLTKEISMEKTSNELMVLFASLAFSSIVNIEPFIFLYYEKRLEE